MEQHLDRIAVAGAFDRQAVFERDQKHDRHCENEKTVVVKRGRHLIHAPERVENIRQRQAHVHAAVEKIQRIRFEHSARAPFADCQQFAAAFSQRQIEGQREHSEIEPVGNDDLREDRAVDNAQHKSRCQDRNVDDRHILEPKAVGQIEQEIRCQQRRHWIKLLRQRTT